MKRLKRYFMTLPGSDPLVQLHIYAVAHPESISGAVLEECTMSRFDDMMAERAAAKAKKACKEKNYTLHIVGTVLILALVVTALNYWFPLH